MALLTKADILAADDIKSEVVACPEWGGDVRVMTMDGPTREKFDRAIAGQEDDNRNVMVTLCAYSICGDDGQPLFTPSEIVSLGKKSSIPLARIFAAASRVSRIFGESDAEKKSETTQP